MNKQQAFEAIGHIVKFKRDKLLFSDHRNTFYEWRKGEECKVLGYVETPSPKILVGTGQDFFEYQEFTFREADKELDFQGGSNSLHS